MLCLEKVHNVCCVACFILCLHNCILQHLTINLVDDIDLTPMSHKCMPDELINLTKLVALYIYML